MLKKYTQKYHSVKSTFTVIQFSYIICTKTITIQINLTEVCNINFENETINMNLSIHTICLFFLFFYKYIYILTFALLFLFVCQIFFSSLDQMNVLCLIKYKWKLIQSTENYLCDDFVWRNDQYVCCIIFSTLRLACFNFSFRIFFFVWYNTERAYKPN